MFEERKRLDLTLWFNSCGICCARCISYGTMECSECCDVNEVDCEKCMLYSQSEYNNR